MVLKRKNVVIIGILISLILLAPFLHVQAWTYPVIITQTPSDSIHAGDKVTVTAIIELELDMIISANIGYYFNGFGQPLISCNEPLPTAKGVITWTLGPFEERDEISYTVVIKYNEPSVDYYSSEEKTFVVLAEDEESDGFLTQNTTNTIYIVAGVALVVIVVAVIIKRIR